MIPKCSQVNCDFEATKKFYWPGREVSYACDYHAIKAEEIAHIMGFHLVIENLDKTP